MATLTIQERSGKQGVRYRALVRTVAGAPSESKTFATKAEAQKWGRKRVAEIEATTLSPLGPDVRPLRMLIADYLSDPAAKMARSKRYSLAMISDCELAQLPAPALSARDIVTFCRDRRDAGAGPATIAADLSHLRAVLKLARVVYGYDADESPLVTALPSLRSLGLIGKPERRTRRPTSEELERLRCALIERSQHKAACIPYADILDFSVLSCMRIGEVCSILWDDLDHQQQAVMVRNRKDPRRKAGNHMMVPLIGGAWEIATRQPQGDDPRIFPFSAPSVTAGFQRVRSALGISDLRYHDLRREGASRLFEAGFSIDQVAQVTGHRDLNTLWQIYTNLNPSRLTHRGTSRPL